MEERVLREISRLDSFPAYVYDLPGLAEHAARIRAEFPHEIFYAAKANPDPEILRALHPHVDGFEVASGGELQHVHRAVPGARLAFGGPGKTDEELALAVRLGVERIHVESVRELAHLPGADVLLRANLPFGVDGAALAMSGPFGMDELELRRCLSLLPDDIRLRGFHAHLASGLDVEELLKVQRQVVEWAAEFAPEEVNLGGGMAVDYGDPLWRFDWKSYAAGIPDVPFRLRIEPGRAMTAYHGWYVTDVLDVKRTRGETYAILRGGTHHLRTPVTKGHDQPFTVFGDRGHSGTATLVGQLCTPKDVFASRVPVRNLAPGSVVAFDMAGAYAWNISHHDFLMHPHPAFHYVT
ncbi:type III PLP-dependent enzyme [Actinocorallia libanotica]|uniref:Type III PLP-dependent enzyme n=1 Tax=Actinocorallia libanotica TaxID=46162 RepID=A0ABP4B9X7_9ACTN